MANTIFDHTCNGFCRQGRHAHVTYAELAAPRPDDATICRFLADEMGALFAAIGLTLEEVRPAPEARTPPAITTAVTFARSGPLVEFGVDATLAPDHDLVGFLLAYRDPEQPTPDQIKGGR